MENILIVNCNTLSDLFSCTHLTNSIKHQYPNSKIHLLTFKEYRPLIKNIKNISQIFTIDRSKISTYKKNRLFSEAFALDSFARSIKELKTFHFDWIINYQQNTLGNCLISYFNPESYSGIKILENKILAPSNNWALLNKSLQDFIHNPIHKQDMIHKITGINWSENEIKLLTDPENNKLVHENLSHFRYHVGNKKGNIRIVAIQLANITNGFFKDKFIKMAVEHLSELIKLLLLDQYLHPILIVYPNSKEISIANQLNANFDNSLLTIEADTNTLPSILVNIDIVATCDHTTKTIADLLTTPTLEILDKPSSLYLNSSINPGNIILSPVISRQSIIDASNSSEYMFLPPGQDLYFGIYLLLSELVPPIKEHHLLPNISIYQVLKDKYGIYYKALTGDINVNFELSTQMARYYLTKLIEKNYPIEILNTILNIFDKHELYAWVDHEREHITETVVTLLETLKYLRAMNKEAEAKTHFVTSLDKLIKCCYHDSLITIPCTLFKNKLDTINSSTLDENIRKLDRSLEELKANIQVLTTSLTDLTSLEYKRRGGNLLETGIF
ncbi:MAG: hypothetical protein HQK49_08425 [Oligoflexia bacterium]|nr:hypothetical protein [Oligoflexia bacterium]